MKPGDLVKDDFGNVGLILEGPATFGNGDAYLIFFNPSAEGYLGGLPWILESMLEVCCEVR